MKTKKITAIDYLKIVEWSDDDQVFIGSAPPLIGRCCHGKDEAKVYQELCQIVDEWIAIHAQDKGPRTEPSAGKEYSGKFVLRVLPDLHRALALRALAEGESLNCYVARRLSPA